MKSMLLTSWAYLVQLPILLTFILPVQPQGLAMDLDESCPPPANVAIDEQSSGMISFSWDSTPSLDPVEVWYVRQSDGFTSSTVTVQGCTVTFDNLSADTYDFYFVKNCGSEQSTIIVEDDVIMT